MLNIMIPSLYRNSEEFQWEQRNFITYMTEALHWQTLGLIGSMWSFLKTIFVIHLCLFHRKIMYATLMTLDKIPQFYRTDTRAMPQNTGEQQIFILPSLPSITKEQEGMAKLVMAITILAIVTFTILDIFICKVQIQPINDKSMFSQCIQFQGGYEE